MLQQCSNVMVASQYHIDHFRGDRPNAYRIQNYSSGLGVRGSSFFDLIGQVNNKNRRGLIWWHGRG
jgi:hypothetical protein